MSDNSEVPRHYNFSASGDEEIELSIYPSVFNQVLKQMGFQHLTIERIMNRYASFTPTLFRSMTVNDLAIFNTVFDYKNATDIESCRMEIIRFIRNHRQFNTHYPQRTFELIQKEISRFMVENNVDPSLPLKINWLPEYGGRIRQASKRNDNYGLDLNNLDEDLFFVN